jgi:hypothetical protein
VTEIGLVVCPELHKYESAPVAVKSALSPEQMVGELTVIIGNGLTVTVATAVAEQPVEVPVTVYEVVDIGVTEIGFVDAPVDHEYESAPLAVSSALSPSQIVGELTVIIGSELTVTVATAVAEQPVEVPVTVYEVVEVGVTEIGFVEAPVDQEYESAPVAVKSALSPEQIVGELTVIIGNGLTVTVATAVAEQPVEVPVTVYEVVEVGVTEIGFVEAPVDQEYESAPVAVKSVLSPEQIVGEFTLTTGNGLTVTVATAVAEQPLEDPVTV